MKLFISPRELLLFIVFASQTSPKFDIENDTGLFGGGRRPGNFSKLPDESKDYEPSLDGTWGKI